MRLPLRLEVSADVDEVERAGPTRHALGLLDLDVGLDEDAPPVSALAADFVFVTNVSDSAAEHPADGELMIGSSAPSRGSISTSSRTMQPPPGSSRRVRSCRQTRCYQLEEDSRKPPSSTTSTTRPDSSPAVMQPSTPTRKSLMR